MFHVSASQASITDSNILKSLGGGSSAASLKKEGTWERQPAPTDGGYGKVRWERQLAPPDGGYGWFVVLCASYMLFVSVSGILTCGIFLVSFADYFKVSKGEAAWIGSLHTGMIAPVGPLLPPILKRFGCRVVGFVGSFMMTVAFSISFVAPNIGFLFFSMGFLGGAAMPLIFMAASVSIQEYFDVKRATASSISVVGAAMGMFVWPPLSQVLINHYSWRGASLLMGAVVAHSMIFSLFLRPAPTKLVKIVAPPCADGKAGKGTGKAAGGCCGNLREKILHAVPKICMFIGWLGIMGGHLFQIAITPIRASYMGIPEIQGALLVSILGLVAGVLRPVAGWLGDRPQLNRLYMVGVSGLFCGVVAAVSISFKSFNGMIVYAIGAGIGGAVYFALQAASVVDVFGKLRVAPGFALLFVSVGIANVATVPIAGYLYDVTGSNFLPVLILDCMFHTVGGVFMCLIPVAHRLGLGLPPGDGAAPVGDSGSQGVEAGLNAKFVQGQDEEKIPVKFGLPDEDET